MKQADLSDLSERISDLAKGSPVGEKVEKVSVEASEESEEENILRVVVRLKDMQDVTVEQVEPLVRSIEDLVSQLDERFASVRFAEAA